MDIYKIIYALELRLRAIYLATDREEDMWNWIDAATVRTHFRDYETERIMKLYGLSYHEAEDKREVLSRLTPDI